MMNLIRNSGKNYLEIAQFMGFVEGESSYSEMTAPCAPGERKHFSQRSGYVNGNCNLALNRILDIKGRGPLVLARGMPHVPKGLVSTRYYSFRLHCTRGRRAQSGCSFMFHTIANGRATS
jgi:hypothetical protein